MNFSTPTSEQSHLPWNKKIVTTPEQILSRLSLLSRDTVETAVNRDIETEDSQYLLDPLYHEHS